MDEICSQTLEGMFRQVGVLDQGLLNDAVAHYHGLYRVSGPKKVSLFSGILETLDLLDKLKFSLAIATNESRGNLENLFPSLGLDPYFYMAVCEDEVNHPKPHPDMIHTILDATGSCPAETLMIGDSVLDIAAGKAAGCRTCAVTYGTHTAEKLKVHSPNWIIDYPTDLLGIIGQAHLPEIGRILAGSYT